VDQKLVLLHCPAQAETSLRTSEAHLSYQKRCYSFTGGLATKTFAAPLHSTAAPASTKSVRCQDSANRTSIVAEMIDSKKRVVGFEF
jgi:hypothetical protein